MAKFHIKTGLFTASDILITVYVDLQYLLGFLTANVFNN